MKTKEEIIAVIEKIKSLNIALSVADYEAVLHYLKLSTINPMKIDEERMNDISMSLYEERISPMSDMKRMIDKYNSTLEDHQCKYCKAMTSQPDEECYLAPQVLQPLPKDKPDWFEWSLDTSKYDLWDKLIKEYGTPTKKELVSVEKLAREVLEIYNNVKSMECMQAIAQHIIDTYSLNPPKSDEFPFNLKEGDKFMYDNLLMTFKGFALDTPSVCCVVSRCTPYIEPSIHDKFMASLSDEQKKLYEEMKEATK